MQQLMLLKVDKAKDVEETIKRKNTLRNNLLTHLRKKGTHNHNMEVLRKGDDELIVEKSPSCSKPKLHTEYLFCEYCFGWYYRVDLYRHIKKMLTSSKSIQK